MVDLFVQNDLRVHTQLSGKGQHFVKGDLGLQVAVHSDGSGVDHGIAGGAARRLQLAHGVEGVPGGLHAHLSKYGLKATQLQGGGQADDLGDTLDAEAYLGVAGGEPPAVRGKDAGTQLVLVHLAQLRNVRCSLSQFRRRPGRGHCLGKYGLDHGVFLLDVDALAFWAQA